MKTVQLRELGPITVASLASGLISYLFVFVGSRVLEATAMSSMLAFWALANTLVLAFAIPLETIAPKFILHQKTSDSELSFVLHGIVIAGFVLAVFLMLSIFRVHSYLRGYEIVGSLFVLSLGLWAGVRSVYIGRADFKGFLLLSLLNASAALVGLFVAFFRESSDPKFILLPIVVGNSLGGLFGLGSIISRRRIDNRSWRLVLNLGRPTYQMAGALILATGVSLMMNNGGIALAPLLGASPEFVITFAAIVSLVQAPMMLLNNISPIVNIRMTRLASEGDDEKVFALYYRILLLFVAFACVLLGSTFLLSPLGIDLFVGSQYQMERVIAVCVAAGVCIDWLTVMPRLLGLALGRASQIWKVWTLGLIAYLGVLLVPTSGSSRLIAAPIVGGLVILAFGTFSMKATSSSQ